MKRILFLLSICLLYKHSGVAQSVNMSNTTVPVVCGTTLNFYDSGGPANNYGNAQSLTLTVEAPAGSCLNITFSSFSVQANCNDNLDVYDGGIGGTPLGTNLCGNTIPGPYIATTGTLTFVFTSNNNNNFPGWAATITCTNCPPPPPPPPVIYTMSPTNVTLTCPLTASFVDNGGNGNYTDNQNVVKTFYAPAGTCLTFSFVSFATEGCCDFLRVFSGPNGTGGLIGTYSGGTSPGVITSTGAVISFSFNSDGSVNNTGWMAIINCTTCPAPPAYYIQSAGTQTLSCPPTYSLFYDSQGPGLNYNNSENSSKTFSAPAGSCLTFSFTGFSTESCCDFLRIYNGPNGGSPLMGTFSGNGNPGSFTSSGSALTFSWTSDGSVVAPGWTANIACAPSCTGTPAAGTATAAPTSSCTTFNSTLNVTGVPVSCGFTFQWQSSAAPGGPFSNIAGATNSTYTTSIASTTYFRRITSCGANSATSSVIGATLSAPTISCSLSTYSASSIGYSFDNFVGTLLPTTDDVLFNAISVFGFPFCFAGQQFNGGYVASNSSFVFDAFPCNPNIYAMPGAVNAAPGQGTGWSITTAAPTNADNAPRNAILGPWQDTDPSVGGNMRMTTLGVAPNRRFVVSWENIPMFSCNTLSFTGQIKLYETSNNIEIHVGTKTVCTGWNGGQAIMGLHNYNGTIYRPPVNATAHNAPTQWSMSNTAYRYTTSCAGASNCAVPLPVEFKALYGQHLDGANKLWWEINAETEFREFIIERSLDATNFEEIARTQPSGKDKYEHDDYGFLPGYINYYKVTAIDMKGVKVSTSIYPIVNTDDQILIRSVYPNPARDKLMIDIVGRGVRSDCEVHVYDQLGRPMLNENKSVKFGTNKIELNIESLHTGIYYIEIRTVDGSMVSRQIFSKQ